MNGVTLIIMTMTKKTTTTTTITIIVSKRIRTTIKFTITIRTGMIITIMIQSEKKLNIHEISTFG